ncbi:hypothetical protein TBK1r_78310 [Stieleria magnilauensis]|uniref:Secreted protein n=1 Tax=Stieleria magnilauensis TaxID=2527963 RepID=A0ABX5Y448_9BACT|nr:hypothetical protein TBK1r_78310 [Planctomycetes bacterium TBK1r]
MAITDALILLSTPSAPLGRMVAHSPESDSSGEREGTSGLPACCIPPPFCVAIGPPTTPLPDRLASPLQTAFRQGGGWPTLTGCNSDEKLDNWVTTYRRPADKAAKNLSTRG